MATKKPMKFKEGGKIKRYSGATTDDSYVDDTDVYSRNGARARDDSPELYNERMKSSVRRAISPSVGSDLDAELDTQGDIRRALAGERPAGAAFTQLPPSVTKARAKAAKAVSNQATQSASPSQSRSADVFSQIPGQSLTAEQRQGIDQGERITGTELGRNVSNTMNALTPLGGGVLKVGTELAMGNRARQAAQTANATRRAEEGFSPAEALAAKAAQAEAKISQAVVRAEAKAAQAAQGEGKLNAAGQRAKNSLDLKRVAEPGMDAAKTNPNYWVAGSREGQKIVAAESKAVQAESKAAQAAARKKAAQAKKDAKDPVMNARPGADKAKPGDYAYESDVAMSPMYGYKKGGAVKKFAKGGSVSSASSRGDGCAIRGKTKGTISKMKSGGMYGGKGAC
jgi:hypothetical protein